jgi:hypothetical protein
MLGRTTLTQEKEHMTLSSFCFNKIELVGIVFNFVTIFIYMKPFEKFLESSVTLRELLDTYLELRQLLQESGFSQEQLSRFTQPTYKMMSLRERFTNKKNALFRQIKDYGFEIQMDDLNEYIMPLLNKIDELIPLSDGNNERGNQGDEDY